MSAAVTISGNAESVGGKWSNHYYEPIYLGLMDNGGLDNHWADGVEYVELTTGSGFPPIAVWMDHPLNAGFTYKLVFSVQGTTDCFLIEKWKDGVQIEDIYCASTSGNTRFHKFTGTSSNVYNIDLGVYMHVPTQPMTNAEAGDVVEITKLP